MSFVIADDIGSAYMDGLKTIIEGKLPHWYIALHVNRPTLADSVRLESLDHRDVDGLGSVLNVNQKVYRAFCGFTFHKHDSWSEDATGRGWIYGRIMDLFDEKEGYYREALRSAFGLDQLGIVSERLAARDRHGRIMNGGSGNGLVCQVYLPHDDLRRSCQPRPRVNNARCLTQVDFKPIGNRLHLMATFRSQYFDTKAYGNLISLALLQYQMCQLTGYKPGSLVSVAHKVVFHADKRPTALYKHMTKELCVVN